MLGLFPMLCPRADIKQYIGLPSAAAIFKIFHSCIQEVMRVFWWSTTLWPHVIYLSTTFPMLCCVLPGRDNFSGPADLGPEVSGDDETAGKWGHQTQPQTQRHCQVLSLSPICSIHTHIIIMIQEECWSEWTYSQKDPFPCPCSVHSSKLWQCFRMRICVVCIIAIGLQPHSVHAKGFIFLPLFLQMTPNNNDIHRSIGQITLEKPNNLVCQCALMNIALSRFGYCTNMPYFRPPQLVWSSIYQL